MKGGGRFLQAAGDFPCVVTLGDKGPVWGLSRWGGARLRFVPPDDEGFVLRGDSRQVRYEGRRWSHRFTILGDTAFEYDCILEKEPENNVITLLMDGAEGFDFFRQPDFVTDPFLKGSYAVYKKETLVGEGTGKLCHIHRPLIFDSRGRRVWGDLSITGNRLCITIPETWLSEAKYPVIVDPTIGTTTVGSQTTWDGEWLSHECSIPVNRFLVSGTINGLCTAYFYVYSAEESDSGGYPVLYSDNGNKPGTRKSTQEPYIDLWVRSGKPAGWRNGTFESNGSISSGSYVWFGLFSLYFWYARFDYGTYYYNSYWDTETIPSTYPRASSQATDTLKLSMYFTYSSAQNYVRTLTQGVTLTDSRRISGNYQRSARQTVRGTSAMTGLEGFYRSIVQSVKSTMSLKGSPTLIRRLIQQVGAGDGLGRVLSMLRSVTQTAGAVEGTQRITQAKRTIADTGKPDTEIGRKQDFRRDIAHTGNIEAAALRSADYVKRFRETAGSTAHTGVVRDVIIRVIEAVAVLYEMKAGAGFNRGIADTVGNGSAMGGMVRFFRALFGRAGSEDSTGSFIARMRVIQDTETVGDETGHTADYLRGLFVEAGNIAETKHTAEYYRKQQDTAFSEAVPLRHLFIFIRLLTGAYIRDYIIGRFLKSRDELVLKSAVVREIEIESRIR